jgi:phosphotransferase system  glucose/maltose/N-acetylglucosamine-specific IIC component
VFYLSRLLYPVLAAIVLSGILAGIDRVFFTEDFGLWTYTLGTMTGMGLALLGLLLSIGTLLFSRRKGAGLALGALIILTGVFTFLLVLLIWLATGMPTPG